MKVAVSAPPKEANLNSAASLRESESLDAAGPNETAHLAPTITASKDLEEQHFRPQSTKSEARGVIIAMSRAESEDSLQEHSLDDDTDDRGDDHAGGLREAEQQFRKQVHPRALRKALKLLSARFLFYPRAVLFAPRSTVLVHSVKPAC